MWISGHTHWSYDFTDELINVRFLSNQIGYLDENTNFKNITYEI